MKSKYSAKTPSISFYDSPKPSLPQQDNENHYRSLSVTTPPRIQQKVKPVNFFYSVIMSEGVLVLAIFDDF